MLLEIKNEVILNLDGTNCKERFSAKFGNNLSNVFEIIIKHNQEIVPLDNLNARYCIRRADGTQNLSDATIEDNKIKIVLTKEDLSSAGLLGCEVILSKDDVVVYTSIFYVDVIINVLNEERIKQTDEYSSIINVLDKANDVIDDITLLKETVLENENLRISSENNRKENENLRQANETQRVSLFNQIKLDSNKVISENQTHTQNAKNQADYAKLQGDYAKNQADRIAESDMTSVQEELESVKGYIGYTDNDIYGVEVDFENNHFVRLAASADFTEGEDFDNINAYKRRRCILDDSGKVIAYYGTDDYVEDGSKGQVMVEQNKFYYKVVPLKLEQNGSSYHLRKARYYISDTKKNGFKLHPAFIQNGVEKDKIYLSAYEGCIYDISASKYLLTDEQVADFNTDKLCSIANVKPCSGQTQLLTRANSRKLAKNRGAGWSLSTIQSISCTQLLFLIEYASFNMQMKIGQGLTKGNNVINTGFTSNKGNTTGVGLNMAITYRGEENIFGNIWTYVDGINIFNNYGTGEIYISDSNFQDGIKSEEYKRININFANSNMYISSFGYDSEYDWLFIPSETIGNSALPVGDYFFQNKKGSDWSICNFGNCYYGGETSGGFCLQISRTSNSKSSAEGARIIYIPQ